MFENITKFFKKFTKKQGNTSNSKDTAKERLHLVLMQDRANVSADFLDLMRQEIIDVIKKYIEVDESAIDVRLTNKENEDGTNGAPALYANIPIINIKEEAKKEEGKLAKEKKEAEASKPVFEDGLKKQKDESAVNSKIIDEKIIKKENKKEDIDNKQNEEENKNEQRSDEAKENSNNGDKAEENSNNKTTQTDETEKPIQQTS